MVVGSLEGVKQSGDVVQTQLGSRRETEAGDKRLGVIMYGW